MPHLGMNCKCHMARNVKACYPLSLHRLTWAVESSSAGITQSCFSSAMTMATAGTLWKNHATRTVTGTTQRAPSSTPARMASGRWLSSPWISAWPCSELFVEHCCVVSHLCGIMRWVVCRASPYSELFVEHHRTVSCLWSITAQWVVCGDCCAASMWSTTLLLSFAEHHSTLHCLWSIARCWVVCETSLCSELYVECCYTELFMVHHYAVIFCVWYHYGVFVLWSIIMQWVVCGASLCSDFLCVWSITVQWLAYEASLCSDLFLFLFFVEYHFAVSCMLSISGKTFLNWKKVLPSRKYNCMNHVRKGQYISSQHTFH